jgi:hypothetical protein
LGRCQDQNKKSVSDLLFWSEFANSQGEIKLLPIPARLTSQAERVLNNIYDLQYKSLIASAIIREEDRNGNPWMYEFYSHFTQKEASVNATYHQGVNFCERNLPTGNPDRIVCDPPVLAGDRGFGLAPMNQLKVTYRIDFNGRLLSKTSYEQLGQKIIEYCEWNKLNSIL